VALGYFTSKKAKQAGHFVPGSLYHEIQKHGISPGGALVDDVDTKDKSHPDADGK
jgi:hypothetical protein